LEAPKKLLIHVTTFFTRFRGEIIISALFLFLGIVASILITLTFRTRDPYVLGFYIFGFLIVLLMFASLFNQKRLLNKKFEFVNQVLIDHFGYASRDNQFLRRREHYAMEKKELAKVLVREVLPHILERIYRDNPNVTKLNIIVDSGTTLTPMFSELAVSSIKFRKDLEIDIYTNSLSGIEEIHKLESSDSLGISQINLIGGRPLSRYRATTGKATEAFLQTLWDYQEETTPNTITLSILTANWFLAGNGLDRLSICARGSGHLEFKKRVSEHSHYRVFVTPLGKLLRLSDVTELNELLKGYEDDEYRSYLVPDSQKSATYLLTTRRDAHSLSPFRHLTVPLDRIEKHNGAWNFTFCKESKVHDPPGKTFEEVFINETPHKYIRENFEAAYGFAPGR
jgi:hypothetical protein